MSERPFISIIIPVRNGERTLANCLASIQEQTYPRDHFEVIIADGRSTDATVQIAKSFGAQVVINDQLTVGPGRNAGFQAARGELIGFSDDDCVMDQDWLANSVKYFTDETVGGVSGPTITEQQGGPWGEAIGLVFELAAGSGASAHRSADQPIKMVEDLPGCNAIYRRTALTKALPIDESLITAEDVALNYLIRRAGFNLLYVPDVKLRHYRRQDMAGFFKQIYRFAVGRLQVGRRYHQLLKMPHLVVGLFWPGLLLALIALLLLDRGGEVAVELAALVLAGGAVYSFARTGSLKTALWFPLVVLTFLSAWSLGFLRELLFPLGPSKREVNGC